MNVSGDHWEVRDELEASVTVNAPESPVIRCVLRLKLEFDVPKPVFAKLGKKGMLLAARLTADGSE